MHGSHNTYPIDTAMRQIDMRSEAVNELCRVIAKFRYHDIITLRLLHRHRDLDERQILLERSSPQGYVVERRSAHEIDLDLTCGQIFSVYNGALHPTQFLGGRLDADLEDVIAEVTLYQLRRALFQDIDFISEVIDVLLRNKLDRILGIEVRADWRPRMIEFSDEFSSQLFDEATVELSDDQTLVCTAWRVTSDGFVDQEAAVRCVVDGDRHKKVRPKPKPKPK